MTADPLTNSESLTHAPADSGQAKARRRRGPVLRPVNLTKRRQSAEHQASVESAVRLRNTKIAAAQGVRRRLLEVSELTDWAGRSIEAPLRNMGSEQRVLVLKRTTLGATMHPDDRDGFSDAELAQVVDDSSEGIVLDPDYYRHVDRIPGSIHRHMLAFQSESQEKAQAAFDAKRKKNAEKLERRAERHKKGLAKRGVKVETEAVAVNEADKKKAREQAEKFASKHREQAAESSDRLDHGFLLAYPGIYAGDHYEPFHEFLGKGVLRSHLSPSLARFAQIVPRKGLIRSGYDKGALFATATKLIALDCPYVELDTTRHCCIVVEFDTVWASAAAFRLALLTLLPAKMLPNMIVGRMTRSGQFARPHCIWYLNPKVVLPDGKTRDACVWNDMYRETTDAVTGEVKTSGNPDCRLGPIKKFRAVQRGLVAHLLPLGADPSCWNIYKPKNPLSPFWTTLVANEDFWPELDDFIAIKDFSMKVDEADLARRGAAMRAEAAKKIGEIMKPSNLMWATIGQEIEPMVAKMLRIRDLSFLDAAYKGVETLTQWFDDRVRPQVEAEIEACASLDKMLDGRCAFAANYCIDRMAKSGSRHVHAFKVGKGKKAAAVDGEIESKPKRKRLRPVNRGRDDSLKVKTIVAADGTERRLTKEELDQANGERSGATRTAVTLWNMCVDLHVAGITVDEMRSATRARKAEIIKGLCQVSPSFAYDRWDEAIDMLVADLASANSAKVRKDKKQDLSPAQTINLPSPTLALSALGEAFEAVPAPATTARTIEPPWLDPADVPPEGGLLDHRGSTCASGPVAMLGDAVNRAPEPVES